MPQLLSIIIPVYNEERTLATIMEAVTKACPDAQMIYVDDGSRDHSLEILKSHARPTDTVLTKPNGGKGSAIREGIPHATGEYTIIQDADLEYDPEQIKDLVQQALVHPKDAVFGSRFLQPNPNIYRLYLMGNKTLTAVTNILFNGHLTDAYTCYKLFPTKVLKQIPLKANGFELEAELCAYPLKFGVQIHEVAITYKPRTFEEGKKIGFHDAWKGVWTMLKIRLL